MSGRRATPLPTGRSPTTRYPSPPIRYLDGSVAAALALVVQAGPASPAGLVPLVQAAARGISRSIGQVPWLQTAAS
jgi:hypothetical protein